jgi:effector-binding domain-containing protein
MAGARDYDIKTRKLASRHTAVLHVSAPPAEIGAALRSVLPEVAECVSRQGLAIEGEPFARFFDYNDDEADFEAGFPVSAPLQAERRVKPGELPGGRAAITLHRGAHDDLQGAHDALGEWVLAHDHDPAGPVWEVYLSGPREHDDPARWETKVVWPLRK